MNTTQTTSNIVDTVVTLKGGKSETLANVLKQLPEDAAFQLADGTLVNAAGEIISDLDKPEYIVKETIIQPFEFLRLKMNGITVEDERDNYDSMLADENGVVGVKIFPAFALDLMDLETNKTTAFDRFTEQLVAYNLSNMKRKRKFNHIYQLMRISKKLKFTPIDFPKLNNWLSTDDLDTVKRAIEGAFLLPSSSRYYIIGVITLYLSRIRSYDDWQMLRTKLLDRLV